MSIIFENVSKIFKHKREKYSRFYLLIILLIQLMSITSYKFILRIIDINFHKLCFVSNKTKKNFKHIDVYNDFFSFVF